MERRSFFQRVFGALFASLLAKIKPSQGMIPLKYCGTVHINGYDYDIMDDDTSLWLYNKSAKEDTFRVLIDDVTK